MPDSMAEPADIKTGPNRAQNLMRTAEFWRRAAGIYLSYKSQQINAWRLRRQGWSSERLRDEVWQPHHTWAGAKSALPWRMKMPPLLACSLLRHPPAAPCLHCCRGGVLPDGRGSAWLLPQGDVKSTANRQSCDTQPLSQIPCSLANSSQRGQSLYPCPSARASPDSMTRCALQQLSMPLADNKMTELLLPAAAAVPAEQRGSACIAHAYG